MQNNDTIILAVGNTEKLLLINRQCYTTKILVLVTLSIKGRRANKLSSFVARKMNKVFFEINGVSFGIVVTNFKGGIFASIVTVF